MPYSLKYIDATDEAPENIVPIESDDGIYANEDAALAAAKRLLSPEDEED